MDDDPVTVFTIPGTKISIDDSLDWLGLGIVTVSCAGSADIPRFKEKFVLFQPDTENQADRLQLRSVCVPKDAKLLYAATVFDAIKKDGEEFMRECIALYLQFESERTGGLPIYIHLATLGRFPHVEKGRYFHTERSFTRH